jgi:hypothetical protein
MNNPTETTAIKKFSTKLKIQVTILKMEQYGGFGISVGSLATILGSKPAVLDLKGLTFEF